jgi:hypothetical protein
MHIANKPSDGDEGDDLDALAAELSEIARRLDYRPARMKRIRSRLVDWLAERDRDSADALHVAYSMGAARARSAPHPDPEEERERLLVALHDAIRRPLGVVPDSAAEFYNPDRVRS